MELRFVVMVNAILVIIVISLLNATAFAHKKSYIVYMGAHSHGPDPTMDDFKQVEDSHHDFLTSFVGSHDEAKEARIHSYTRHINGFSAHLDEDQAAEIAKHPKVISVFPSKTAKQLTTRLYEFMELEKEDGGVYPGSLWEKSNYGEDVVIANFDSGIWPEKSFSDDRGYGPIPKHWRGSCEVDDFCNRKLIGAKMFKKEFLFKNKDLNQSIDYQGHSMNTARDFEGHGTHTLSTAGGNFVTGVNINNVAKGVIKGGAPRARVAAYKVCWINVNGSKCEDSDILAGLDMAIHDRTDVLSISLAGDRVDYFEDGIATGTFHAAQQGITVVAGAGNEGPSPLRVTNIAPWIITVGATTMDRVYESNVQLHDGTTFKGQSISSPLPEERLYPLINAIQAKVPNALDNETTWCYPNTLDATKVKGKIVVCMRGQTNRVNKGMQAAKAGAVGMIIVNDHWTGNGLVSELHVLPATLINYKDGLALYDYINSTKDPRGYITPPKLLFKSQPAPIVALFSSRGPNNVTHQILKPDIVAPGVNIISSVSEGVSPIDDPQDKRRFPYMIQSGTSCSTPVIAGIAAALKSLHPHWSPAAIRSAMMTTARVTDSTGETIKVEETNAGATPFDYGAGFVQPNHAMDPGLVYDLSKTDYLDFLCAMGYNQTSIKSISGHSHKCSQSCKNEQALMNFNYPSITVPKLSGPITVTRKLKNVGAPATYAAFVSEPEGVSICVEPKELKFSNSGKEKEFKLTLSPREGVCLTKDNYVFGQLRWSDGKHNVTSPIVVGLIAHAS